MTASTAAYGAPAASAGAPRPEGDLTLTWDTPAGCPARDRVLAEVEQVFAPHRTGRPIDVRVVVTRLGDATWHAELALQTSDGRTTRTFEAASCDALARASVLIVGVAMEALRQEAARRGDGPLATSEPGPAKPDAAESATGTAAADAGAAPAEAPGPPAPPPTGGATLPPPSPASAPRERAGVHAPAPAPAGRSGRTEPPSSSPRAIDRPDSSLELSLGGVVTTALLPSVAPGGELSVGWLALAPHWRLRAQASVDLFAPEDTNGQETATVWLASGTARVCVSARIGRLDFGPCVGGELNEMWVPAARGPSSFRETRPVPHREVFAVAGSGLVTVDLSTRVALFGRVDADWLPTHPATTFVVGRSGDAPLVLYSLPDVSVRGALGLAIRFF